MKIKLYNDIAFKWVFGRQQHTGPLIRFINAVIGHEGDAPRFSEVSILNPFDLSEPFKNEKQGVLDIRAMDQHTGEWFNLEVQVRYSETYPQRTKFYLAGLYRDQLGKNQESNYNELKPVFGIHILVGSLFQSQADQEFWFNRYMMLNTRTHIPLVGHWHLYYVELNKLLKLLRKYKKSPAAELEQWSCFIGTIQDNTRPLDTTFQNNEGIQEVYDMLQSFTQNQHLRERYRVQEEYARVQRTDQQILKNAIQERDTAVQKMDAALKAEKAALKAEQAALKAQEKEKREKEAIRRTAVQALKLQGLTDEKIVELLKIPQAELELMLENKASQ